MTELEARFLTLSQAIRAFASKPHADSDCDTVKGTLLARCATELGVMIVKDKYWRASAAFVYNGTKYSEDHLIAFRFAQSIADEHNETLDPYAWCGGCESNPFGEISPKRLERMIHSLNNQGKTLLWCEFQKERATKRKFCQYMLCLNPFMVYTKINIWRSAHKDKPFNDCKYRQLRSFMYGVVSKFVNENPHFVKPAHRKIMLEKALRNFDDGDYGECIRILRHFNKLTVPERKIEIIAMLRQSDGDYTISIEYACKALEKKCIRTRMDASWVRAIMCKNFAIDESPILEIPRIDIRGDAFPWEPPYIPIPERVEAHQKADRQSANNREMNWQGGHYVKKRNQGPKV